MQFSQGCTIKMHKGVCCVPVSVFISEQGSKLTSKSHSSERLTEFTIYCNFNSTRIFPYFEWDGTFPTTSEKRKQKEPAPKTNIINNDMSLWHVYTLKPKRKGILCSSLEYFLYIHFNIASFEYCIIPA